MAPGRSPAPFLSSRGRSRVQSPWALFPGNTHPMSDKHGPGSGSRLNGLSDRLAALRRNPAIRGIAGVFVMKSSIIVANFVLIMLAARVLDPDRFGNFS